MKRWITFIILILLACAVFVFLIFMKPSLWTGQLLTYFNSQIEERYNIHINAGRLTGNILNNLSGSDVVVTTLQDSTFFTAEGLNIQYSLWKIMIGEFAIDEVHIDKPIIRYNQGLDLLVDQISQVQPPEEQPVIPRQNQFTIDRLSINEGQFIYQSTTNRVNVNKITGEMRIAQGAEVLTITGEFSSLQPPASQQTLRSIKFLLHQFQDSVVVDHAEFMYDSASVHLNGTYLEHPQPHLQMNYLFSNIAAGAILRDLGIRFPADDQWNINGTLQTDFNEYALHTSFSGKFRGASRSSGNFQAVFSDNHIAISTGEFQFNEGRLSVTGTFTRDEGGNAHIAVRDLNLADVLPGFPASDISGEVTVRETSGDIAAPNASVSVDLAKTDVYDHTISGIAGNFRFREDTLQIADTLRARVDGIDMALSGWYSLDGGLDGLAQFRTSDSRYLSDLCHLPDFTGNLEARLHFSGTADTTAVRGGVNLTDFQMNHVAFDSIVAGMHVSDIQRLQGGNLVVQARHGRIAGKNIGYGSLSIESRKDSVFVHDIQLEDSTGHFYATGKFSRDLSGKIDTLIIQYQDMFIHNRTNIPLRTTSNGVQISRGMIGVNDGFITLSGVIRNFDSLDTKIEFTNLDLGPLNNLLRKPLPFTGNVSGELAYRRAAEDQAIQSDIEIINAVWRDLHYDRIQIIGNYYDKLLAITKGSFLTPDGGELTISGKIPLALESSLQRDSLTFISQTPFALDMQLNNMHLVDYTQFVPIPQDLAGIVSGQASLSGTLDSPESTMQLTVKNPGFARLEGTQLDAKIAYRENKLFFNELRLQEADGGLYTGTGFLPLTFNPVRGEFHLQRDNLMDLQFHAETSHLQFLEKYLGDLEGFTGECTLDLYVVGTPNTPIRNGHAIINDATLEISSLENEITGVQGDLLLQNNIMTVNDFSGYMYDTQEQELIEGFFSRMWHWFSNGFRRSVGRQKPNVFVEGSLDFQKFFKPGLDLQVSGENVYIRTLLSEVEGLVDPQISLVGRDTLHISGDVEIAEELVIRKDFAPQDLPKKLPTGEGKGRHVELNLHTDFPGNVYIKNAQVNAEFEGEVWLIQHGREPLNISGSLSVLNGKFYYNDTFTIEEGEIFFDPVENNPRLNIVASTEIEDVTIRIILSGELDNPNITLESTGESDMSESDILSLLTFNSQVEQEGLATPEFQSIFTTYLERQLESYGSNLMGFETFDVETQGQGLQDLKEVTITVGQRVSPNLYFIYGRDFFAGTPGTRLGLEYQVNKYVSFIGEVDEEGHYHFNYRLKYNY
ncbi:MAG TPA: translocation/assembly module TamB domain-containing protein [bacterium]|nr:translocation/assembly module TamB domain-containing protein [bacterium]